MPSADRPNATIYFLAPEENPGYIRVRAVWEIDLVPTTSPLGCYASVRRYQNGVLTHYYDVFYPGNGAADVFQPAFVALERRSRRAVVEGSAIDRFKVARNQPFYFVWLPDPAINPYNAPAAPAPPAGSPKETYAQMGTKSSLLVVLPLFPSL